jgi:hypothetical protein
MGYLHLFVLEHHLLELAHPVQLDLILRNHVNTVFHTVVKRRDVNLVDWNWLEKDFPKGGTLSVLESQKFFFH